MVKLSFSYKGSSLISQTPPFIIQQSVIDFMVDMTDFRNSFISTLMASKTQQILSKILWVFILASENKFLKRNHSPLAQMH